MPHASERSECNRQVMRTKSCVSLATHPHLFRPKCALDHACRMIQDQGSQQHLGAIGIHDMVGQRLPVLSIFRDVRRPSELKIRFGGKQRHDQRAQCRTHNGRCVSHATYLWSAACSQSPLPSAQQPQVWVEFDPIGIGPMCAWLYVLHMRVPAGGELPQPSNSAQGWCLRVPPSCT